MIFIKVQDLLTNIKDNVLTDIIQTSSLSNNDQLLTQVEAEVLQIVRGYLNVYYDCDTIFSQIDEKRNPLIVSLMCNIMIYILLSRTTSDILSENRIQRYNDSLTLLKDISNRKIVLDLPEKNINYEWKTQLLWTSNLPNSYDY